MKLSFIRHIVSCQLLHFVRVVSPHPIALQDIGNSTCKKRRHQAQAHSLIRSFTAILLPRCLNLLGGFDGCCFGVGLRQRFPTCMAWGLVGCFARLPDLVSQQHPTAAEATVLHFLQAAAKSQSSTTTGAAVSLLVP